MDELPRLVMTPKLQQAIGMLAADHRALVALIARELAETPGLRQIWPPAPVGEADLALALEPDQAWVEVAFQGEYEADDRDAEWFVRSLDKRAETCQKVVALLAEHHRPKLEGTGPTERMRATDLAEQLGVHPSTISRVLAEKTIRFEREEHLLSELLPFR